MQKAINDTGFRLNSIYDTIDCTERSFKGNYYNLYYVNLWIEDTLSPPSEDGKVLILDVYKNKSIIAEANAGNGYRIITYSKTN